MTKSATQLRVEKQQRFGRKYAKSIATALETAGLKNVQIARAKFQDSAHTGWQTQISADGIKPFRVWVRMDQIISGYMGDDQETVSRAEAGMNIGLPYAKNVPANFPRNDVIRAAIVAQIKKDFKAHFSFSDFPWYHDDCIAHVGKGNLGELCREPYYESRRESASRYDPQQAYYDRQTPAARARAARISQHQFASDIGGCAANYR